MEFVPYFFIDGICAMFPNARNCTGSLARPSPRFWAVRWRSKARVYNRLDSGPAPPSLPQFLLSRKSPNVRWDEIISEEGGCCSAACARAWRSAMEIGRARGRGARWRTRKAWRWRSAMESGRTPGRGARWRTHEGLALGNGERQRGRAWCSVAHAWRRGARRRRAAMRGAWCSAEGNDRAQALWWAARSELASCTR
jgi:hypothetical protein